MARANSVVLTPAEKKAVVANLKAELKAAQAVTKELTAAGKVVAKQAIIDSLADFDDDLSANAVEQYVSRLRKRLAPFDLTVKTARGLGYYLDKAAP